MLFSPADDSCSFLIRSFSIRFESIRVEFAAIDLIHRTNLIRLNQRPIDSSQRSMSFFIGRFDTFRWLVKFFFFFFIKDEQKIMSLYDDDDEDPSKSLSRMKKIFVEFVFILLNRWFVVEFDQITSRFDSCKEISSATTKSKWMNSFRRNSRSFRVERRNENGHRACRWSSKETSTGSSTTSECRSDV